MCFRGHGSLVHGCGSAFLRCLLNNDIHVNWTKWSVLVMAGSTSTHWFLTVPTGVQPHQPQSPISLTRARGKLLQPSSKHTPHTYSPNIFVVQGLEIASSKRNGSLTFWGWENLNVSYYVCRNVYSFFCHYGKILLCLEMPQRFSREERFNYVLIRLGYAILRILRYFNSLESSPYGSVVPPNTPWWIWSTL